ncbi:class A beta-lactamase [Kribbella deserti]|uniref:Beta-lactamase n=1 Tax=Kribbella deserti TaxID=1926257 RepID=A0ABV6QKP4_9ACTN
MGSSSISRRAFFGTAALIPLAACSPDQAAPNASAPSPTTTTPPEATPSPTPRTTPKAKADQAAQGQLIGLERKYGARLGVYALNTGTGATLAYRADERFAFCSTFKGMAAAAVLHHHPLSHLETLVTYTKADLLKRAPITGRHLATGMTIRQLCDAAVRYSDGVAGNLLLRELGGPAQLTAYLRSLGDNVSRMDRIEPAITQATPGDPRDTTTPRAFGTDYQRVVLGDALPPDKRAFLRDLLVRNTTGGQRIRAGLPRGWTVADKTGTGDYGTLNDIAIAWPPNKPPLVLAIMSSKPSRDAPYNQALLAEAATHAAAAIT